ncbi:PIN domain-containing protein [Paenibacillus chitinolyticus]
MNVLIWYNGVVIDTCVWIDIANNKEDSFLKALESLIVKKFLKLVIPEQVLVEWNRNKDERIISEKRKWIENFQNKVSELKLICSIDKNPELINLLNLLEDSLNRDLTNIVADYESYTERIDKLLSHPNSIHLTDSVNVKNQAVDFALKKKAPFYKKNSMADALIFFSTLEYSELKKDSGGYTMFITKNHNDFGGKEQSNLHEHLEEAVDRAGVTIEYYNSLREAVNALQATSDDWDNVINEWEEEERERERKARSVLSFIGTCDDCYKDNQMGYFLYDSFDVPIMGFCEKCYAKRRK